MTWQQVLGRMRADLLALQDTTVAGREAEEAARSARAVEDGLWRWRRSVEAAYLSRHGSVPSLVAAAALQEEVPPLQLVGELLQQGALVPSWWRLDRWAAEHGLRVWPEATEGEEE